MDSKKEKQLKKAYDAYIDLMLYDFPVERIYELVAGDVTGYGTTVDEKVLDIKRLVKIVLDQREQGAGIEMHINMIPVHHRISPDEDIALYMDEFEVTMVIDGNSNLIPLRLTSVFEYSENAWKLVHLHGSKAVETEGDTWHLNEWKKKNAELQKLVDEKTEDLSKKNRELEIEAALERVRARTMAMHNSEELAETAAILFQQMTELGVTPERINICLIKEADNILEVWATDQQGTKINHHFNASLDEPTTGKRVYNAWKEKKKSIVIDLSGKELDDWIRYVREVMGMTIKADLVREHRIHSVAFFSQGMILTTTPEPLPEESIKLLDRFADVFNLTYRRFLDLQKAEAQAREAQIEASLERIRSHALGMQKSEEVGKVTDVFFAELTRLTVKIIGCSIVVIDEIKDSMEIWRARSNVAVKPFSRSSLRDALKILEKRTPEWYEEYVKGLKIKKGVSCEKLTGEKRIRFLTAIAEQNHFSHKERARYLKMMPEKTYSQFLYFKLGYLALISEEKLPEENLNIARRFADVFDFAYTRFLDIKKAEEQAGEAIKQTALDRIRGQIASMRKAEDLQQLTPLIWRELKTLEVPFFRCGIFIINEQKKNVDVYLTTPEGNSLAALHLAFNSNNLTRNTVASWKKKEVYQEHWNREEFIEWMHEMMKLRQVKAEEEYQGAAAPPDSLHLHFIPFAQGMLYIGNTEQLSDEKIELVKSLAEAFSFAYARYQDFVVLEKAKERVEKTLSDLKATQTQLVHAEKMASLGELTAGIAHEIQNPLNFVNNFAEVSADLIKELNEGLQKGESDDVKSIAADLLLNLEKINDHGKRASNIVKSMLEHSRAGTGEKQLTDLNALTDEYLHLAYHGLRAKDKSFNADFKLEADENLPKVNVVPQDIGRVLLNLINNAFYSVSEKQKSANTDPSGFENPRGLNDYNPVVTITTKKLDNKIEIRVKDNGNGIPDSVKDKIFQPFFTTKPTGQGTGLGLSLSYDIIKAHGGELSVETKAGEGTEFIIQLPIKA